MSDVRHGSDLYELVSDVRHGSNLYEFVSDVRLGSNLYELMSVIRHGSDLCELVSVVRCVTVVRWNIGLTFDSCIPVPVSPCPLTCAYQCLYHPAL